MAILNLITNLEEYIRLTVSNNVLLTYVLLFMIIFVETGVVIMPFLPGDSILFLTGALIAKSGVISFPLMFILLCIAAILGDSTNYTLGKFIGKKIEKKHPKWLNKKHLDQTEVFFEKHGVQAITIARFIPIVRTFAPFVAGISHMHYRDFIKYNIIGGILWISIMLGLGYFFGNLAVVKNNFSLVLIAIIVISFLPVIIAYLKDKKTNKK